MTGALTGGPSWSPPDRATLIHDRFVAPLLATAASRSATDISGSPTDEEAVAVMAAIEHLWPRPVLVLPVDNVRTTPPWRFSGRWWVRPVAARRDRPYV